jgi:F-type H+-transporting ATPase subunit alpha
MPAIDVSRSVSRIGGKAQIRNMREEAGRMKLDYLQFLELEVFTRFGAKLDAGMEQRIRRGRTLRQIFRQVRLAPWPAAAQLAWVIAYNEGCFDGDDNEAIDNKLARLLEVCADDSAALTQPLDEWRCRVRTWLGTPDGATVPLPGAT